MKAYTDFEQSKKLAEILPIDSADYYYGNGSTLTKREWSETDHDEDDIPCWSLAALMNVIKGKLCHYDGSYYCQFIEEAEDFPIYSTCEYDNPIDCCVEMIIELHNRKLL